MGSELNNITHNITQILSFARLKMHLCLIFQMMRDLHLILFVLVLVLIDVVFITVWICYDPLKPEDIVFEDAVRLK